MSKLTLSNAIKSSFFDLLALDLKVFLIFLMLIFGDSFNPSSVKFVSRIFSLISFILSYFLYFFITFITSK